MKNTSLILSIISLVAVVAFGIVSLTKGSKTAAQAEGEAVEAVACEGAIVYIDLDRILMEYDMANDLRSVVETKVQNIQAEVTRRGKKLEKEVTAFQVDDWDFESTHISLTAAGNYGPDGSCSVSTLVMSPGSGGVSGVSTGGSSGSASTGDASTSLFIILAVLVAAGTVLVTVRKVAVA